MGDVYQVCAYRHMLSHQVCCSLFSRVLKAMWRVAQCTPRCRVIAGSARELGLHARRSVCGAHDGVGARRKGTVVVC